MDVIFKASKKGAYAKAQAPQQSASLETIPSRFLRTAAPGLPGLSELDVIRHFTCLSSLNFSIDTHPYPLGSCTMKYNPRAARAASAVPGMARRHPLAPEALSQGFMECAYDLQEILKVLTGMAVVSLTPMAGSQGEFAGVAMIKAYHASRGDHERVEILVPDAAHGTNPASAAMCGFQVKELATLKNGDVDLEALRHAVGPKTAGIMLTNPSTLGVFERHIEQIAQIVHQAGGLLYYDGANLNAILGRVRPGDMGFDVVHLNLHKTFATPHGGGGPGSGPIAANERLRPFIPTPIVIYEEKQFRWSTKSDFPQSIGRLSAFMGNAGIQLRAYVYARLLGSQGLRAVSEFASLNANYLMHELKAAGFTLAYPERRASHEFIITLSPQLKQHGVSALDLAKRLLDYGIHAPTIYFPLLIPECLLIEPTETESKATLDRFVEVMKAILHEIQTQPERVKSAPHTLPVKRLDEVKAAKELDLIYSPSDLQ